MTHDTSEPEARDVPNECLLVFQPRNYECIAYLNNLRDAAGTAS